VGSTERGKRRGFGYQLGGTRGASKTGLRGMTKPNKRRFCTGKKKRGTRSRAKKKKGIRREIIEKTVLGGDKRKGCLPTFFSQKTRGKTKLKRYNA